MIRTIQTIQTVWTVFFRLVVRRWRAVVLIVVATIGLVVAIRAWDDLAARLPWSAESRLDRAEDQLAQARASLRAHEIEAEARATQARELDAAHAVLTEARAATARAVAQSEGAPDADQPLPADRLDRLRVHDRGLCELSPALCPDAADDRAAGPVAASLRPAAPAG